MGGCERGRRTASGVPLVKVARESGAPLSSTGRNVVLLLFLERERGWEEEKEAFQFLHRPKKKCVGRFFLAFLCVVVVFALSLLFASFLSPFSLFFCRSLLVAILFPSLSLFVARFRFRLCARVRPRFFFLGAF